MKNEDKDEAHEKWGPIIAELGELKYFGESALLTAARTSFMKASGLTGTVNAGQRNATVRAGMQEGGVQIMHLNADIFAELFGSGAIDKGELQQMIDAEQGRRDSMSTARAVWNRSRARSGLEESRRGSERRLLSD